VTDSNNNTIKVKTKLYTKTLKSNIEEWHQWCKKANKGCLMITHGSDTLVWYVREPIDKYLSYRNNYFDEGMAPMSVKERDLENYSVKTLFDSQKLGGTCMNCHTAKRNNINHGAIHIRGGSTGGTYIIDDSSLVRYTIPKEYKNLRLAYFDFHPQQEVIAFSTNRYDGAQRYIQNGKWCDFMTDTMGIIVLYDIKTNTLTTAKSVSDPAYDYASPCWSRDGKTLYFCRGPHRDVSQAYNYKFDLYKVEYDSNTKTFGNAECIFPFSHYGVSGAMPKFSPTENFLVVSVIESSTFPSLNDGDYYIVYPDSIMPAGIKYEISINGRKAKENTAPAPHAKIEAMTNANSLDGEKYHSFSSNGRWMVFSSCRLTGTQAITHIVYIDKNGKSSKPFILPQETPNFYKTNIQSFIFPNTSTVPANYDAETTSLNAGKNTKAVKVKL
jgi:hypothetical protein